MEKSVNTEAAILGKEQQRMKIKMELLSDVIFGNGVSVPGGEDISVLCDKDGFPYYKGGTFKGVFREELAKYFSWLGKETGEAEELVDCLLGDKGGFRKQEDYKLVFSDFVLSGYVKEEILKETGIGEGHAELVKELLTHQRTLTSITEDGVAKEGSLRSLRCVNKGLYFYSELLCHKGEEELVKEVLSMIKWVGSMRNRGFGKVKITVEE